MKRQAYLDLQEKHRKELNEFPIAYAFNDKQLQEALEKLGAESVDECVTVMGSGDIVKKENGKPFLDLLKRQVKEVQELLLSDIDIAEAAFLYEMDNHEYAINWSGDEDVMSCFGIDENFIREHGLQLAYESARRKHMKHAEEWEMI